MIGVVPQTILPTYLLEDLQERYEKLGGKYASEEIHEESGLRINSCMDRDNMQECYEELVDAVFNCLVYIFRNPERGHTLLISLLTACEVLADERQQQDENV